MTFYVQKFWNSIFSFSKDIALAKTTVKGGKGEEGKGEVKNNTQIYTTQEGIEQIKNNPQVYTCQEGIEQIKNNPQVYTCQEGIEQIKSNP